MRKFILFILTATCIFQTDTLNAQINVQDSLALVDLYNSTDGAHWTHTWNLSNSVKTWYGITISGDKVLQIYLVENNLTGIIPVSLGNLSGLQNLILPYNQLSGTIPASLGNLLSLQKLCLYYNQLNGPIPSSLGNLTNLKILWLYKNHLSGNIPSSLGNLINLQNLTLSANQLSGIIPSSFGNLVNLQQLELSDNQLGGSIPSSLGNLSNLWNFSLSHNQLSGNIPSSLGNLYNLKYCNVSDNQLTGAIPSSFANYIHLKALQLNNNYLSDSIHSFWGSFASLYSLDLSNNQLSGPIPGSLGNSKSLQTLYLNNNHLKGSIPAELGNISSLYALNLQNNKLTGSIPDSLSKLGKLGILYLDNNKLSGGIPISIGNITSLTDLRLGYNPLSGSIPSTLGKLLNLQKLFLNSAGLNDTIPSTLNNLANLKTLGLVKNHFTFSSVEQLVQAYSSVALSYSPQSVITLHIKGNELSVSAGGTLTNNTFYWYREKTLIETITGDSTFTITKSGSYHVIVTNSVATELALYSDTINTDILPIDLLSFTVVKEKISAKLTWQTATEQNSDYFNIQRSSDGIHFSTINKIRAAGNSNSLKTYAYTDANIAALKIGTIYYRIQEVDKDGRGSFSGTQTIKIANSNLFSISPNPAKDFINIVSSEDATSAWLSITDTNGKLLYSLKQNFIAGQLLKIPIPKFSKGVLIVNIKNDSIDEQFKVIKE